MEFVTSLKMNHKPPANSLIWASFSQNLHDFVYLLLVCLPAKTFPLHCVYNHSFMLNLNEGFTIYNSITPSNSKPLLSSVTQKDNNTQQVTSNINLDYDVFLRQNFSLIQK